MSANAFSRLALSARTSVDAQTRSALKKDDVFIHSTQAGLDWIAENRTKALRIAIAVLVVIALAVVGVIVYQQRSTAAANAFGNAVSVYSTPIADPAQPVPPGVKTFPTVADRAKAANPLFEGVAKRYSGTTAGHNALYFSGLTAGEMGNTSGAEATFRKAGDLHDANLASLAHLALANLLAQHGQTGEAIKLYQELINHPSTTVPAATAQLQLAQLYEANNQPAEANKIYALLKAKDPATAAGQIAAQKLGGQH
jgi:predicted negative regulator of RcsB-dependent stress response